MDLAGSVVRCAYTQCSVYAVVASVSGIAMYGQGELKWNFLSIFIGHIYASPCQIIQKEGTCSDITFIVVFSIKLIV